MSCEHTALVHAPEHQCLMTTKKLPLTHNRNYDSIATSGVVVRIIVVEFAGQILWNYVIRVVRNVYHAWICVDLND